MARLTDKQKLFCKYYTDKDNTETYQHVTHSAIAAGYSEASAHVTGSRMLKDAKIIEYISFLQKSMEEIFAESAKGAAAVLQEIMDDKKAPAAARVKASTELLSRAGYGTTVNVKGTIQQQHSGSVSTTQEIHVVQEVVNSREDVADALLDVLKARQNPVQLQKEEEKA